MGGNNNYDEVIHHTDQGVWGGHSFSGGGEASMTGDAMHGKTHFRGPDVEINSNGAGVNVVNSSGENSYQDNRTGEMIDQGERLRRSGSAAPTSLEYSGNKSLGHMGKKGAFSAVKDQSIVDKTGTSTPIGNTSMGQTASNIAIAGQDAVAKGGSYDQMEATANSAKLLNIPVSPDLQSGIAEGKAFKKSSNYAPGNVKGH